MTILNAHFVGKQLVLDDPVPDNLPANAKVRVTVETETEMATKPRCLAEIAKMAIDADLPKDFSTQFAHYTKGYPRK